MDYKKILNNELKNMGLSSRITNTPKNMQLTTDDIVEFDVAIAPDVEENEEMRSKSAVLAGRCGLM